MTGQSPTGASMDNRLDSLALVAATLHRDQAAIDAILKANRTADLRGIVRHLAWVVAFQLDLHTGGDLTDQVIATTRAALVAQLLTEDPLDPFA
jgi:hypothetical protein